MKVDHHPVLWIAAVAMATAATLTLTACGSSANAPSANAPAGAANAANSNAGPGAATAASKGAEPAADAKDGCPTATAVSGAAGIQLSTAQVTQQGDTLMCSYPSANGILALSREADAEYSPETAKSALESQAQALGLGPDSVKTVHGVGDAAYEFTQDGSTTLGIVSGAAYIAVIGAPSPTAAKADARLFVK